MRTFRILPLFRLLAFAVVLAAVLPAYGEETKDSAEPNKLISINTASAEELQLVPGIGPSTAEKIIAYREEVGEFGSLDELTEVAGIGSVRLERIRPFLTVELLPSRKAAVLATTPFGGEEGPENEEEPGLSFDLNTATAEELQKIPGIGSSRANQIIERRNYQPYDSLWELRAVIPEGIFQTIVEDDYLYVSQEREPEPVTTTEAESKDFGSLWWIGGILLLAFVAAIWSRERLFSVIEKPASLFRLSTRILLTSLVAAGLAAGLLWLATEKLIFARAEENWEGHVEEQNRQAQIVWDEYISQSSSDFEGVYTYIRGLSDQFVENLGVREEEYYRRGSARLFFTRVHAHARTLGMETILLDRRTEDGEIIFSPGIPETYRNSLVSGLIAKVESSKYSSLRHARNDRGILAVSPDYGEAPPLILLYSGGRSVKNLGDVLLFKVIGFSELQIIKRRLAHDVVLRSEDEIVSTTIFTGKPVVTFPFHNATDGAFLVERVASVDVGITVREKAVRNLLTGTLKKGYPFYDVRNQFLSGRQLYGLYSENAENLDQLIPYVEIRTPLPVYGNAQPVNAPSQIFIDSVRNQYASANGHLGDFYLFLNLFRFAGTDANAQRDILSSLAVYFDTTPESLQQIADMIQNDLDWRKPAPLHPMNLYTASSNDLTEYLKTIGISDYHEVSTRLEKFIGASGEEYRSSHLLKIPFEDGEKRSLLAGLLYRTDPTEWERLQEQLQRFQKTQGEMTIDEAIFEPASFPIKGWKTTFSVAPPVTIAELDLLIDKTAFLADRKFLRATVFGAVGTVFVLTLVAFQIMGVTITRPLRRLTRAMSRVSDGSLDEQLPLVGRDELAEASRSFNLMVKGLSDKVRLESGISRYLPVELIRSMTDDEKDHALTGKVVTATILFADLRGFTRTSQMLSSTDTLKLINLYFDKMVQAVENSGGTVDKFIGDALLAVWGVPNPVEYAADSAVTAAREIQKTVNQLNDERRAENKIHLEVGIGISSGEVIAGNVGTEKRSDYTVIGQEVNLAQRLSSEAGGGQIFISSKTYHALNETAQISPAGEFQVKGISAPVVGYEVSWHGENEGKSIESVASDTARLPNAERERGGETLWYVYLEGRTIGPLEWKNLTDTYSNTEGVMVCRAGSTTWYVL